MKYKIDKGGKPAYLQLYNQIKKDIITNAYTFKSKLPSKRVLSEEFGVSIITVEHAYDLLVQEGYVEAKARSGYYVIYKKDDFLSHLVDEQEIVQTDFSQFQTYLEFHQRCMQFRFALNLALLNQTQVGGRRTNGTIDPDNKLVWTTRTPALFFRSLKPRVA